MTAYTDLVAADGAVAFWPLTDAAGPFASAVGGPSLALTSGTVTPQGAAIAGGAPTVSLAGELTDASLPVGAFDGTADWTVEAWVRVAGAQTASRLFYLGAAGATNGLGLFIGNTTGGTASRLLGLMGGRSWVDSGVDAVPGDVYHFVLRFQAGIGVQCWLNGSASGTFIGDGPNAPSTLTTVNVTGDVGYVAVYPTALTSIQLADHYAVGVAATEPEPPTIAAGHLALHGGDLDVLQPVAPPALAAGHLTLHGGTLDVLQPQELTAHPAAPVGVGRFPIGSRPAPPFNYLLTEDGDVIVTEDGDTLVWP